MNSLNNSGAKSTASFILSVLTLALAAVASYLCASDEMFRAMMKLSRQSDLMAQQYVSELSAESVFNDAWRGMQAALPFRVELTSDTVESNAGRGNDNWGLTLSFEEGAAKVVAVSRKSLFFGTLRQGDLLTAVEHDTGQLVTNLEHHLASARGDSISINFKRSGTLDSAKVLVPNNERGPAVEVAAVDDIVYCGLREFNDRLEKSVEDSLHASVVDSTQGVVVDLRESSDGDGRNVDKLAKVFLDLRGTLPLVLLVDHTTCRQGELLAVELLKRDKTLIFGNEENSLQAGTEVIPLRSGRSLYVHRGQRNDFHSTDSGEAGVDSSGRIGPQIRCEPPLLSGLTVDLLNRNYFLDFVAASAYEALPSKSDEEQLFNEFADYLAKQGYSYDPLRQAYGDLQLSARSPEARQSVQDIGRIINMLPKAQINEYRPEITHFLLIYIQQIKVGGEPTVAERLRLDDYCLQAAVAYLRGLRS